MYMMISYIIRLIILLNIFSISWSPQTEISFIDNIQATKPTIYAVDTEAHEEDV